MRRLSGSFRASARSHTEDKCSSRAPPLHQGSDPNSFRGGLGAEASATGRRPVVRSPRRLLTEPLHVPIEKTLGATRPLLNQPPFPRLHTHQHPRTGAPCEPAEGEETGRGGALTLGSHACGRPGGAAAAHTLGWGTPQRREVFTRFLPKPPVLVSPPGMNGDSRFVLKSQDTQPQTD